MKLRPGAFVDRDGTVNEEVDYLSCTDDLRLLPGAGEGIARLRDAGFAVVVVTNQSAIARGMLTEEGLGEIHRELKSRLAKSGAELDGIYYCPHHPDHGTPQYRLDCECRKPKPGMLRRASSELGIDLSRSYMVGDTLTDLQAGWNAGCQTVLVLTGYGRNAVRDAGEKIRGRVAHVAGDLGDAARWILDR